MTFPQQPLINKNTFSLWLQKCESQEALAHQVLLGVTDRTQPCMTPLVSPAISNNLLQLVTAAHPTQARGLRDCGLRTWCYIVSVIATTATKLTSHGVKPKLENAAFKGSDLKCFRPCMNWKCVRFKIHKDYFEQWLMHSYPGEIIASL